MEELALLKKLIVDQDKEESVTSNVKTAQTILDFQMMEKLALPHANHNKLLVLLVYAHHAHRDKLLIMEELALLIKSQLCNNQSNVVLDNTESAQLNVEPAQPTLMLLKMDYHAVDAQQVKLLHSLESAHHAHMDKSLLTEETATKTKLFNKFK